MNPPSHFSACIDDMCCAFVKSHLIFAVVCVVSCRARALELELGCTICGLGQNPPLYEISGSSPVVCGNCYSHN